MASKDERSQNTETSQPEPSVRHKRLERIMAESLLAETNALRSRERLPPLVVKQALNDVAYMHSSNMCTAGELKHESDKYPVGWRTFWERMERIGCRSGGENLAYRTYTGKPTDWSRKVLTGWLNSPQHRKNLLDPTYRYTGIGVFLCRNGVAFATQVFSSQGTFAQAFVDQLE